MIKWFVDIWSDFNTLQQIFLTIAIPSTLILVLQTILLLIGLGGNGDADNGEGDFGDADADGDGIPDSLDTDIDGDGVADSVDLDGDGIPDVQLDSQDVNAGESHDMNSAGGLRLLTIRGIVAFFAVGGWLGVALVDLDVTPVLAVILAFAGGFAAMLFCALIIKWSLSLQENGAFSAKNAIAHTATVYIPIPPERQGTGKVTLTVQERFLEVEAMTDEDTKIPTGKQVQVVSVIDKNILLVRTVL